MVDAAVSSWEQSIVRRLAQPDPERSALMDLYDYTSASTWSFARSRTTTAEARASLIDVYRMISDAPSTIRDLRVPLQLQLCALVARRLSASPRALIDHS